MAVIDLDDVPYSNIGIKGYSDAALTTEKETTLFFTQEAIKISASDISDAFYSNCVFLNSKLTKYTKTDCQWQAVVYIIPCALSPTDSKIWIKGNKGAANYSESIFTIQNCDFFNNTAIPWPDIKTLNPKNLSFTNGFNKLVNFSYNNNYWLNPLCKNLRPGYYNPEKLTITQVGWSDNNYGYTNIQPFILLTKFLFVRDNTNRGDIEKAIANDSIILAPTYNSDYGACMMITGVEPINA